MTELELENTPIDQLALRLFMQSASPHEWAFYQALPDAMPCDRKLDLMHRFRREYADYTEECAYFKAWSEAVNMVDVTEPTITRDRTDPDCEFCELGACVQEVTSFRDAQ